MFPTLDVKVHVLLSLLAYMENRNYYLIPYLHRLLKRPITGSNVAAFDSTRTILFYYFSNIISILYYHYFLLNFFFSFLRSI